MIDLKDSDIFMKYINHDNILFGRIGKILSGAENTLVLLNNHLIGDVKSRIVAVKKEKSVSEMGYNIEHGNLALLYMAPEKRLPDILPFFVATDTNTGKKVCFVNMNPIVNPIKVGGELTGYEFTDMNKAYTLLYSANLAITKFTNDRILSESFLYKAAVIWAEMFNKPVYDAFGMNNPERNAALMYFSMKFFLRYMMQCSEKISEKIALGYFEKNGRKKNDLILFMEDKIQQFGIQDKIYTGVIPYLTMLFNNEISQAKGLRVANITKTMNVDYYIQRFSTAYSPNALLGICTFPYFVYNIISAMGKSKMVKDKAFDRIFQIHSKEVNRFLIDLTKD